MCALKAGMHRVFMFVHRVKRGGAVRERSPDRPNRAKPMPHPKYTTKIGSRSAGESDCSEKGKGTTEIQRLKAFHTRCQKLDSQKLDTAICGKE